MNSSQAQQMVVSSMAATAAIVIAASASRDHKLPEVRTLVGLAFLLLFLSVLADLAPEVAGPLGVLVLLSAMFAPPPGGKQSAAAVFLEGMKGG